MVVNYDNEDIMSLNLHKYEKEDAWFQTSLKKNKRLFLKKIW
jgi:hypothetical protein